ncbi:MAG TPA: hypothetical protein PL143_07665 [Rhodocyclaceae bacterium]|nr:hypothetical protein [Rhodocyclaceae bacterium]
MERVLGIGALRDQNEHFRGTGGVSDGNRSLGFAPAFLDRDTGDIHRARFANGQPAPCHILDGLPAALVCERAACGRVLAVKASVVAGFVRDGRFLTRAEAAEAVQALAA